MNKKVMGAILGAIVVVVGLIVLAIGMTRQPESTSRSKPATNTTVAKHVSSSSKASSSISASRAGITDTDVVGVWINHHNKDIHQKITFTADHKWKENQHHVTNIYSGTWKRIGHNQILLAPYNEKIHLYGDNYQTMNVLSYDHILNKQTN